MTITNGGVVGAAERVELTCYAAFGNTTRMRPTVIPSFIFTRC